MSCAKGYYSHTPEAKAAISAAKKGKTLSPETRAKISAAKKGQIYKRTPVQRAAFSTARVGLKYNTWKKYATEHIKMIPLTPSATNYFVYVVSNAEDHIIEVFHERAVILHDDVASQYPECTVTLIRDDPLTFAESVQLVRVLKGIYKLGPPVKSRSKVLFKPLFVDRNPPGDPCGFRPELGIGRL